MTDDDTRTRILRAAASSFARFGFEGASLRRIADEAGIKAASIFHHFRGGKRELYEAILHEIAHTLRVGIVDRYGARAGLKPEDAVVQMAAAFWDYFEDHRDYATLILLQASGMDRAFAANIEALSTGLVEASKVFICEAQARGELGEFDVAHFFLWSAAHTLTVHGAPFLAAYVCTEEERRRLRDHYLAMVRQHVHAPKRR